MKAMMTFFVVSAAISSAHASSVCILAAEASPLYLACNGQEIKVPNARTGDLTAEATVALKNLIEQGYKIVGSSGDHWTLVK